MATAWRKVKSENDLSFTIQDMLKVYYGKSDYAKYDNSKALFFTSAFQDSHLFPLIAIRTN